jgi:hypothetical protein
VIDIERQQMVQQVVASGNAREHFPNPGGRLFLVRYAWRSGAATGDGCFVHYSASKRQSDRLANHCRFNTRND